MADSIGTAFVDVAFDPKQISGQLGGLGGKVEGGFGKMGGIWGKAAATGFGAAIVAGVAAGKYLYDVGEQFDAMADKIRVSTGKTGKELESLVKTAKGVGTDVPASFEDAGEAVAQLSTRLGLTGKPLRDVSDQMLELARLSGSDLTSTLNSVTRMLGDAGLKGAEASEGIDKLWRASQASQVPVNRLADLLTKFGGPLRQLGFSFDEQAALLAKFEKEGVNTELVMGSMRIALGKMAKAGKEPVAALRETITAIKDTADAGDANRKAIELFGARAGPDMAAAIREGRFSIDELLTTIKGGSDTVLKAGADTRDFSENWQIFKNQVAVALAPLAEKMFAAMGDGMAFLNREAPPLVARLRHDLGPAMEQIGETVEDVGAIVHALSPVFRVEFALVENYARTLLGVLSGLATAIGGVVKIVRALLEGDWRGAWKGAQQVVEGLSVAVRAILTGLLNYLRILGRAFLEAGTALGKAIVDGALHGLSALGALLAGAINAAAGAAAGAAVALGAAIVAGLRNGLAAIGATASTAVGTVKAAVVGAFAGAVGWLFTAGQDVIRGLGNGIASMAGWARDKALAVVNGVKGAVSGIKGFVTGSPSRWAIEQGKWVSVGIGKGLELGTQAAVDAAQKMADRTIAAARKPLEQGVSNLQAMLTHGFQAAQSAVQTPAEKALAALQARGVAAMSEALTPAEKALAALEAKGVASGDEGLTNAEKQLAALQAAREDADRQTALADAREQQRQATTDAEQLAAAKALDTAEYAILVAGLEKQAAAEQAARDTSQAQRQAEYDAQVATLTRQAEAQRAAREADQVDRQTAFDARVAELTEAAEIERRNLEGRQFVQQQQFDQGLASLTTYLESSKATAAGAQTKIEAFMKKWGISFGQLGALLGTSFAKGVTSTTHAVEAAAANLKAIVEDALDTLHRAQREFANAPKTTTAGGKAAPAAAPAAGGLAAPAALASSSGGTYYGTPAPFAALTRAVQASASAARRAMEPGATVVRVYIGDRELRDVVRTEVGYVDDETARVALGGLVGAG